MASEGETVDGGARAAGRAPAEEARSTPAPMPRPWLAALLALLCNGLGHLYAGSPRIAVSIQVAWLALAGGLVLSLRSGLGPTLLTTGAAVLFWLAQAIAAAMAARRRRRRPDRWHAGWGGLVAFYALATAVAFVGVTPVRGRIASTYAVGSAKMSPTLLRGDWVVVVPGVPDPLRGAVVLHAAPEGSPTRAPLVARVIAVAGDRIEVREGRAIVNGESLAAGPCPQGAASTVRLAGRAGGAALDQPVVCAEERMPGGGEHPILCAPYLACGDFGETTVPPGHVFVLGDYRDHSADSRYHGPIPVGAILGRASWIYMSLGDSGPRWDRVGLAVR